jgi:hypothetical protein
MVAAPAPVIVPVIQDAAPSPDRAAVRAAPVVAVLGDANGELLHGVLNLGVAEIAALQAAGVVG